ncbi:energy transducer TonB [Aquifex pyrophilus]
MKYIENFLYLTASVIINLIFLKVFSFYLFARSPENLSQYKPLEVKIVEVKPKKSGGRKKETLKKKSVKVVKGKGIKVEKKERKEVSILPELEKRIRERLRKREELKKEIGEISAVLSKKSVKIKTGSRKLTYVPPPPTFKVEEFPSRVVVKVFVDPDGKVIKALIIQRSGIAEIDNGILKFVKKLRFEKIEESEIQEGIITFTFST